MKVSSIYSESVIESCYNENDLRILFKNQRPLGYMIKQLPASTILLELYI